MKPFRRKSLKSLNLKTKGTSLLLAFDYDGTLAPITADRNHAPMGSSTKKLLKQIALWHPVAIVTGRSVKDVKKYLSGVAVRDFIGNHGAEINRKILVQSSSIQKAKQAYVQELGAENGIDIEDKKYSLSIHYRASRSKSKVLRDILWLARQFPDLKVIGGKDVVNLVPKTVPGKGWALAKLMKMRGYKRALFVGDDLTDEDVFGLPAKYKVTSVRIGKFSSSRAKFFLRSQKQVDELLRWILESHD